MPNISAKVSLLATGLSLLSALATGCPEEPPIERRLCERFDSCNFFGAGIDVSDCTDIMTMCTEDLVTSQKSDWTRDAERALENDNCINFLDAYAQVDVCFIDDEGEIGDPTATSSSSAECSEGDRFDCTGEHAIAGCIDGEAFDADCKDVCGEDGLVSAGCGFGEEKGHDVCFCDDGGGTSGPGETSAETSDVTTSETTAPAPPDSSEGGASISDSSDATTAPAESSEGGVTTAPGETSAGETSGPVPP